MKQIKWIEKYMLEAEQLIYDDQFDQAIKVLHNLLHVEPGYGRLHNHLGWAYLYYSNEVKLAQLHLKFAVRFDPEFAAPYLHLGELYIRQTDYVVALSYLEEGLTKQKANRVAFLQSIAHVYELKGEWRKAIGAYKKAMMASVHEHEVIDLVAGIKRCRRKRFTLLFS